MTFLKELRRSLNHEETSYFGLEVETIFLGIDCIRLVNYKKTSYLGSLILKNVHVRLLIEVTAE